MSSVSARQQATQVTLIGMALDLFLGIGKILGGVYTQSFALTTDGIHSLTDAVTDVFVLLVARVSHTDPDENHPYGHGRFETLGTIALGIVLVATAAVLIYDSYKRLFSTQELAVPALAGVVIALVSIASKEWIFQYTMRVAKRLNSSLLRANAWHSRSDAISSIAVLIGILAAQQGYAWMDTLAAVFVALIIAKVGWDLCTDSLKELVDTAIPAKRRKQIEQCILAIEGVMAIHQLRTRVSGGKIILDLGILVSPRITVSEGHQIAELVSHSLVGRFSDIADVLVHVDPEPAAESTSSHEYLQQYPAHAEIQSMIRSLCSELIDESSIENIALHILEGGVEVDLTLSNTTAEPDLADKLAAAMERTAYVSKLRVFTKTHEISLQLPIS